MYALFCFDKLLKVEFPHKSATIDEEKKSMNDVDIITEKFGISPCRPNEIIETIQKEIDKLLATTAEDTTTQGRKESLQPAVEEDRSNHTCSLYPQVSAYLV